jgi:predicted metal-binding membrane protein
VTQGGGISPLESHLQSLLRRDRLWIAGTLVVLVILSWSWLVPAALDMEGPMAGLSVWMMAPAANARFATQLFLMWSVMMTGMMLPSAAPTLLLYARVVRTLPAKQAAQQVHAFAGGYLFAWIGFSLLATLLQLLLNHLSLLTPMMRTGSHYFAAAMLIVAGVYQWLPFKQSCLSHCRTPARFISDHWRKGASGAVAMGLHHGLYCLGCCWALMLLLFVGGVMNLRWILAITALVLLEKLLPFGNRFGQAVGLLLVVAGLLYI